MLFLKVCGHTLADLAIADNDRVLFETSQRQRCRFRYVHICFAQLCRGNVVTHTLLDPWPHPFSDDEHDWIEKDGQDCASENQITTLGW
ncbi:hypothetical protein FQZ97_1121640 [compost metagenome]